MTLYSTLSATVCQPSVDPHGRMEKTKNACARYVPLTMASAMVPLGVGQRKHVVEAWLLAVV